MVYHVKPTETVVNAQVFSYVYNLYFSLRAAVFKVHDPPTKRSSIQEPPKHTLHLIIFKSSCLNKE